MSNYTVHLTPGIEQKLRDRASQVGQTLEVYLERLAESAAAEGTALRGGEPEERPRYISDPKPSQADLDRLLSDLAAGPRLPVLPPDFSRADIYDDHD
jgi:hypothetical protein